MAPEAFEFAHFDVAENFGLAGESEGFGGGVGREGAAGAIAPIDVGNGAFNGDCAGATGADAHAVYVVGSGAIQVYAIVEEGLS